MITDIQLLFLYFVKFFNKSMPPAFFLFSFSDFLAHNAVPNAEPDTNDISSFLSSALIKIITCVLSSLFPDELVSLGRISEVSL